MKNLLRRWLSTRAGRARKRSGGAAARSRPALPGRLWLEALEDRLCPSDVTFGPAVNWNAGLSPFSVAVGDFNGDGRPDLAVATA